MSQSVCILLPDKHFMRMNYEIVSTITRKELLQKYAPEHFHIYKKVGKSITHIEDPLREELNDVLIGDDCVPINKYIFTTRKKYLFIPVDICNENGELITHFVTKIVENVFKKMTFLELAESVSADFGFENKPIDIYIDNKKQKKNRKVFNSTTPFNNKTLSLWTLITESGHKMISLRENVISEIVSTEVTYIYDLEVINSIWQPELRSLNVFTKEELSLLFDDIPKIIDAQKAFLTDMKEASQDGFFSFVSLVFLSSIERFKRSSDSIINHPQIVSIVSQYAESKQFMQNIERIAKKTNGRDFLSFMITIVQRLPRYKLFFGILSKSTPSSHYDSYFLPLAEKSLNDLSNDIDAKSKTTIQKIRIDDISKSLQNQFQLKKLNRQIINVYDVSIKGTHDNRGVFVIFNDIVVLIKCLPKGLFSILFDAPSHMFHFANGLTNSSIIITSVSKDYNKSILNQRKTYTVIFKTKEEKSSALDDIYKLTNDYVRNTGSKYILNWNLIGNNIFTPHCWSYGTIFGDLFYIFGGQITEQRLPGSELMIIDKNMHYVERTTLASGRYGHTLTEFQNRLYVIGGRTKNKVFRKILCFDTSMSMWIQPLPNGSVDFTARYGHTTVAYNNRFYIFGGKTLNKTYLNDLTIYEPQSSTFYLYNMTQESPPARSKHAAAVVGDKMYIYGGKNGKEMLSDLWVLDLVNLVWTQKVPAGELLGKRKNHSMLPIGNTLIILGGTTEGQMNVVSKALNTESMTVHRIVDVGNVPPNIKGFSAMVDRSGKLFVAGGLEQKEKKPSQSFYEITVYSEWLQSMIKGTNNLCDQLHANSQVFSKTIKHPNRRVPFNVNHFNRESEGGEIGFSSKRRSASAVSALEMIDGCEITNENAPQSPIAKFAADDKMKTPKAQIMCANDTTPSSPQTPKAQIKCANDTTPSSPQTPKAQIRRTNDSTPSSPQTSKGSVDEEKLESVSEKEEEKVESGDSDEDESVIVPTTKEEKEMIENAIIEIRKKEKAEKKAKATKFSQEKLANSSKINRRRTIAKQLSNSFFESIPVFTSKVSKKENSGSKTVIKGKKVPKKKCVLPPPPPKFIRK